MIKRKRALITGITGQDGSYLAEFLLKKGYLVFGMYRRSSEQHQMSRIKHLLKNKNFSVLPGDLLDGFSLDQVLKTSKPHEIYNLASQSHVALSFKMPIFSNETNYHGVVRLVESMRKFAPKAKLYQASTSELFGENWDEFQNEETKFNPVSPYAEAKEKAHYFIKRQRERKGLFACSGILFNHESPRRGINFVTEKITDGLARIKLSLPQRNPKKNFLELGNLDAKRDWGFAGDYVRAMWLMLQQKVPKDYIIASGKSHTVREFAEAAAKAIGLTITWKGKGIKEEGYDQYKRKIIGINPKYFRDAEVPSLRGDSSLARKELKWKPRVSFEELVKMMVDSNLKRLKNKGKE